MGYATTISSWGNSEAVRIPKDILRTLGLSAGDKVNVSINSHGAIDIAPEDTVHRRVKPLAGVTFASLFDGYDAPVLGQSSAWPDDDMVGAEMEAWR